jgi:hypothetical protein
MSREQDDPLLAALGALPGARLNPEARAGALARAEQALAVSTAPRARWRRWLSADTLLPAVLCVGGVVYAAGALQAIARVYGPGASAASARAGQVDRAPTRYSFGGGGLIGGSALRTPLVFVMRR